MVAYPEPGLERVDFHGICLPGIVNAESPAGKRAQSLPWSGFQPGAFSLCIHFRFFRVDGFDSLYR